MEETKKTVVKKKPAKRKAAKKVVVTSSNSNAEAATKKAPAIDMGAIMRSAVDNAGVSIMMIDRDFKITYVNQSTINLIKSKIDTFLKVFPFLDLDTLVGTCIDVFHKDPRHQRKLLSDVNKLPYSADIKVAHLIFRLNVSAIVSPKGEYIGNCLEWSDVTESTKSKQQSSVLLSSVEGSGTAMLSCDRNLTITYANPASVALIDKNLEVFQKYFPDLTKDNLVGSCIDIFHKKPSYQRKILGNPENLPHKATISVPPLFFELNVSAMFDAEKNYVGNSLEWADVTEKLASDKKAASLYSMIETANTNYMIANMDRVITYCNPAVVKMLTKFTSKLRGKFKNFDASALVGICIDEFHENPAHQKSILSNKANLPYQAEINVAGLEFGLNAMALLDEKGNHFGIGLEWTDLNDRAAYRNEVDGIISSCNSGDLKHRGDVGKVAESFKPMLAGINEIIAAIVAPISEVIEKLTIIAKGDLTAYVTGDYKGDHEKIKNGLNDTLNALNELLVSILQSAENVSAGAVEISSSSQSLSQAATEQAASLEEITSSVGELNSQTKQNAQNALQANQLSESARSAAQEGGKLMGDMVSAMQGIEESSKNISKIIKVIDEIAFQTNLLALNAAVEAARAGAHGKGFAVVAEEVRNLAARSANAAKETTELIEGSAKKVGAGTSIAQKTASSLNEIVTQVSKVNDLVAEIASASKEQAEGLTQINAGLEQLEKVTQQNTAVAEESASASVELKSQGSKLISDLGKFNLKKPENQIAGLPQGLTPEMLAMIKKMMAQQGQQSFAPVAHKPATEKAPERRAKSNTVNPDDIIPMDDMDNLGRFK